MKYETLIVERSDNIATVTLNRPEIMNAMNGKVMFELKDLFHEFRADQKTRFVIFTGAGKAFSSGVEFTRESMDERYDRPELRNERLWQILGHEFMHTMENLEQVTIAAINGAAVGAGLCLAMNCDFRIVSENAYLGIPEAALGIFFTWGATPRLTALIGPAKAKEMIMTCDNVSAHEALRIGLANKVVPAGELMRSSRELAAKIASKGPLAVRICKKIVNAASIAKMADLYPCEPELVERIALSDDLTQGVQAFMNKTAPVFSE